ncbi:hypothetical protein ABGB18_28785 [Nonomuraea sp. B12E4]|uniref:hypothetical protein n=1 Tax=Nonomuraea sp. B12E4 TaxID=3153564 RepID=UPI00325C3EFF
MTRIAAGGSLGSTGTGPPPASAFAAHGIAYVMNGDYPGHRRFHSLARKLGASVVTGFTGSKIWRYVAMYPPVSQE